MRRKGIKRGLGQNCDAQQQMSIYIGIFYFCNALNLFVQKCIGDTFGSSLAVAIEGVMILGLIFNLRVILLLGGRNFILAEIVAVILFFISSFIGAAKLTVLLYNMVWLMGICIPIAVTVYYIDKNLLYHMLEKISKPIILILAGIYIIEFVVSPVKNMGYEMSVSYAIALPIMVLCNSIFEKVSFWNLCWAGIAMILNLLYGCRGSNICIIAFLVIKILFGMNNKIVKKYIIFFGTLIGIVGMAALFFVKDTILIMLGQGKLNAFRSLETILNKGIFYGSGRGELFAYFGEQIVDRPVTGWGICGAWQDSGNYPHNIMLEILVSFGVIIGGILIFLIMWCVLKAFRVSNGKERNILLIYLALNIQLLVSGTFLQSTVFFICMALCISIIKNYRKENTGRYKMYNKQKE